MQCVPHSFHDRLILLITDDRESIVGHPDSETEIFYGCQGYQLYPTILVGIIVYSMYYAEKVLPFCPLCIFFSFIISINQTKAIPQQIRRIKIKKSSVSPSAQKN